MWDGDLACRKDGAAGGDMGRQDAAQESARVGGRDEGRKPCVGPTKLSCERPLMAQALSPRPRLFCTDNVMITAAVGKSQKWRMCVHPDGVISLPLPPPSLPLVRSTPGTGRWACTALAGPRPIRIRPSCLHWCRSTQGPCGTLCFAEAGGRESAQVEGEAVELTEERVLSFGEALLRTVATETAVRTASVVPAVHFLQGEARDAPGPPGMAFDFCKQQYIIAAVHHGRSLLLSRVPVLRGLLCAG